MSFDYIERAYGWRFHRGQAVYVGSSKDKLKAGVVMSATHYVHVRVNGEKHADNYHPSDVYDKEEHDRWNKPQEDGIHLSKEIEIPTRFFKVELTFGPPKEPT